MTLEEDLKALFREDVLEGALRGREHPNGFLVHSNADIHVGKSVESDLKREERILRFPFFEQFRRRRYAQDELQRYLTVYIQDNPLIDPEDVVMLTKWRLDEINLQHIFTIQRYTRRTVDQLMQILTLVDYYQLNELQKSYKNAVLVKGMFRNPDDERADLLVLAQNTPYQSSKVAKRMMLLDQMSAIDPTFRDRARIFYQKMVGSIDFGTDEIELNEI